MAEFVAGAADDTATDLALEFIDTRAAFGALEAEWTALFQRAGRSEQVFQSFGWLWHWCRHFLEADDRKQSLAIVTGRRNGTLVLACPFVVVTGHGVSTLTFMGDPVSQYGDVLIEGGADAQSDMKIAFDFVLARTGVSLLHLRKVRSDSALVPLLLERGALATETQQAPHLEFNEARDYSIFEQRYSKSARKNRKRQMRRLQEIGATSVVRLTAGPEASGAAVQAVRLKRDWLRRRGLVSSAIADARTEAFFRDCASGDGPETGVEIGFIRSNGGVAAIEIAIQCKDRVAVHLIAYDARFEKTGAGSLLMEDSIRRACQSGIATFDLLAPGAAYKFEWADRVVNVSDYALGLSVTGKIYTSAYLARLRPAAKMLHEHLPTAFRRHLATLAGAAIFISDRAAVT
jgi:CelD/BcsL family acetyltransferase involved in cellulose biosynthesis